jgi:hypothetical protein
MSCIMVLNVSLDGCRAGTACTFGESQSFILRTQDTEIQTTAVADDHFQPSIVYTEDTKKDKAFSVCIKPTTMKCSRSLRMVKFTCLQYKKTSVENARVDKGSTKLPTLKEFISLLEEQVVRIKHDNTLVLSQTPSINLV